MTREEGLLRGRVVLLRVVEVVGVEVLQRRQALQRVRLVRQVVRWQVVTLLLHLVLLLLLLLVEDEEAAGRLELGDGEHQVRREIHLRIIFE